MNISDEREAAPTRHRVGKGERERREPIRDMREFEYQSKSRLKVAAAVPPEAVQLLSQLRIPFLVHVLCHFVFGLVLRMMLVAITDIVIHME